MTNTVKRLICAAATVWMTTAAQAETIDFGTVKCSELATMSSEDGTVIFTWLAGYVAGVDGRTIMSDESMKELGEGIGKYCAENPDVSIVSAATEFE